MFNTGLCDGQGCGVSPALQLCPLLVHHADVDRESCATEQNHQTESSHNSDGPTLTTLSVHYLSVRQVINQPPHRMAAVPVKVMSLATPVMVFNG